MKKKNNPNLSSAVKQIELYIRELHPKNYQDIKLATKDISKAAISAYLNFYAYLY